MIIFQCFLKVKMAVSNGTDETSFSGIIRLLATSVKKATMRFLTFLNSKTATLSASMMRPL